jgi:hypothetical protein
MTPQPHDQLWQRAQSLPSPSPHVPHGTMDTGADGHYINSTDKAHLTSLRAITPQHPGHSVLTADHTLMTSTHRGVLALDSLGIPQSALQAHVFDDTIMDRSLISMSTLASHGFPSVFTNGDAFIVNDRDPASLALLHDLRSRSIASAKRDPDGLWTMPLVAPPSQAPLSAPPGLACTLVHHATNAERVLFMSRSFSSLPASTIINALSRGLVNYPGVTADMFRKNMPNDILTPKGHMRLVSQGQRSTQPPRPDDITDTDFHPPTQSPTKEIYTRIKEVTRQQYIDATGAFPIRAFDGPLYILCVYDFDSNYIRAEPLDSNSAPDVRDAYKRALDFFRQSGYSPSFLRLDNATSGILETFLASENITFQFVAPSNHRANIAERAIQTWKNHFVSTICGTDPDFPLQYWSDLVLQAEITLNLVRSSRVTPNQSSYQHVTGKPYDFNACPIAPLGTKVLVYDAPKDRASWDPHGQEGFYIGPAPNHYRNFRCRMLSTGSKRVSDTVSWHPIAFKMPFSDQSAMTELAIMDLTTLLSTASPPDRLGAQPFATHTPSLLALAQRLNDTYGDYSPDRASAARPTSSQPSSPPASAPSLSSQPLSPPQLALTLEPSSAAVPADVPPLPPLPSPDTSPPAVALPPAQPPQRPTTSQHAAQKELGKPRAAQRVAKEPHANQRVAGKPHAAQRVAGKPPAAQSTVQQIPPRAKRPKTASIKAQAATEAKEAATTAKEAAQAARKARK